jgi:hypothetical protein
MAAPKENMRWESNEVKTLIESFQSGTSLENLARWYGQSEEAVNEKLLEEIGENYNLDSHFGCRVKLCLVPHGRKFRLIDAAGQPLGPAYELIFNCLPAAERFKTQQSNGWYSYMDALPVVNTKGHVTKIGKGDFHLSNHVWLLPDTRGQEPEPEQPKKRSNKMALNIAALMRDDTKTVECTFTRTSKPYTYVTHLPVELGDCVVVPVGDECKIAYVTAIHEQLEIDPSGDLEYAWVIGIVDMGAYQANKDENLKIETLVAQAQRNNMRNSFANNVLSMIDPDKRTEIEAIINKKGPPAIAEVKPTKTPSGK